MFIIASVNILYAFIIKTHLKSNMIKTVNYLLETLYFSPLKFFFVKVIFNKTETPFQKIL